MKVPYIDYDVRNGAILIIDFWNYLLFKSQKNVKLKGDPSRVRFKRLISRIFNLYVSRSHKHLG